MRRLFVVAAGLLAFSQYAAPHGVSAIPPSERRVVKTLATGQRLVLTLRWERGSVGGGGGVPVAAFQCDAEFSGPADSVAVATYVACYVEGNGAIAGMAPGRRAASGGTHAGFPYPWFCVQGYTEYTEPILRNSVISIPPSCD